MAQDTAEQSASPDTQRVELPETQPEEAEGKAIVVTGSRIKTSTFNSPSPIAVIDPEIAEKRGVIDTAEMIQASPIASGSAQVTSAISSNFVTDGGPGASTISLRGLGANRTLVLLNSRRAGPAGTRGAVSAFDLNVLPQSIIQQVQIEKDGASSVYGSDAVAGVVNILTKTHTEGLELSATANVSQDGGADQFRMSGAWGTEWGGSLGGHVMIAADYYKQTELAQGQRKYLDCPEDYIFDKSGSRIDLVDPRTNSQRCAQLSWGQVYLYDYSYLYGVDSNTIGTNGRRIGRIGYSYPGENLGNYVPGIVATNPWQLNAPGFYGMGYSPASGAIDHLYKNPMYGAATVIPQTKRLTFYGDASVHLGEHVEAYVEGLWNRRETYQNGFRQFWNYTYTGNFDGGGFGDPRITNITGAYILSPTPITDHADSSQRVDYWRAVGGLRGDFGSFLNGWTWDGYVQYSKSKGSYTNDQIYKDSVDQQTFRTDFCTGEFSAVRHAPCVDMNWTDPAFLAGEFTQAQRDYLFGVETGHTDYSQLNGELSVTGSVITLPAGDLGVAGGITVRRDSIYDRPGDITYALIYGEDPNDPDSYINNSWGNTSSGITAGNAVTKEVFAELDVPLIYNTPFVQQFTVSGSARLTNYTATRKSDGAKASDNGNWTYKVGANWQVNDWLRFRGTYGTSYRAPALFEQFLANQSSFIGQRSIDPCINYGTALAAGTISQLVADNCASDGIGPTYPGGAATATVLSGGGLGVVKAETSTAKSVSLILTPRFDFLPGTRINLAVDYFDIRVKGEISQLGAANIVFGCYNSNFFATDPLCSLFTRQTTAPVNAISVVHDSFINVNEQENEGVDVTANVAQDLGSWGRAEFTAEMTWQMKDTKALYAGTLEDFNGRAGEPIWTGGFNLLWTKGTWSFYYGLNVIGGTSDVDAFIQDNGATCLTSALFPSGYCEKLRVSPVYYHSLSITKELANLNITLGVTNLFNTKPPRVSVYGNGEISTFGQSVFSSQYDLIGRRGFVTVKAKF
ncbi:TonB-dependent receptor [Sphingomonas sp.]|uniref:TonB-dependent receptor domain-containing protein n=1 Tax=Sphingomonas sp. TaxID=28214 RepID=UPI001AFE7519|nr:TonB-dependent receptor [Sphingomonas sp.]MBO9712873.1 TonB-dependent receptor [Sphingomonas sp.]